MMITWNGGDLFKENLQSKPKVKGEDPHKTPPSPPSSPYSSSSNTSSNSTARKHSHKHKLEMPLLKLDVKFVLHMYDGEVNAEKLDN
jgi:hypothetical protein